jgi:hypothetical protein
VYNNRGQYTPQACPFGSRIDIIGFIGIARQRPFEWQDCEVDACNEHIGGGGGQPHLHGDPFHSTDGVCLCVPVVL